MPKNLILCSDGTGNSAGKSRTTNVWRMYEAIDVQGGVEQRRFYDDGVGTDGNRWWRMFTGATGLGLSRNIRAIYAFLAENYEHGDGIYLFGFSRGAFTVRALVGMVVASGLMDRRSIQALRPGERRKALRVLLKNYRRRERLRQDPDELEGRLSKNLGREIRLHRCVQIRFIGVWDTVGAVGMPVAELRYAVDNLAEIVTGARLYGFHDNNLSTQVGSAAHALALDDERTAFFPEPWHPRQGVEQVWFAGVHSSVGGGQPRDALAYVSLAWMMKKARSAGLELRLDRVSEVNSKADAHGKNYDSRAGLGMFYRPQPRFLRLEQRALERRREESQANRMDQVKEVHASVGQRIRRETDGYAPLLPEGLHLEGRCDAEMGLRNPGAPWGVERGRRRLYFSFLAVNIALGSSVIAGIAFQEGSCSKGLAALWNDFFATAGLLVATYPCRVLGGLILVFLLAGFSRRLKAFSHHKARAAWRAELENGRVPF